MLSKKVEFVKAESVWSLGCAEEMNVTLVFKTDLHIGKGQDVMLRLTASTEYMVVTDGHFTAVGPARCGHGFFRVDELPIGGTDGEERDIHIEIVVAGYNINAFMTLDAPSFLCAEVVVGGEIAAYTSIDDEGGFQAFEVRERVRRVQRYSFQRPFVEMYDYNKVTSDEPCKLERAQAGIFIERGVPMPDFSIRYAQRRLGLGPVGSTEEYSPFMDRAIANIGPQLKGYPINELEVCTAWEAQKLFMPFDKTAGICEVGNGNNIVSGGSSEGVAASDEGGGGSEGVAASYVWHMDADTHAVFDMGSELTGMIRMKVSSREPVTIYAMFDEILQADGSVNFLRMGCSNVCVWKLPAGKNMLMTFEAYSLRYMQIAVVGGACDITELGMRMVQFHDVERRTFESPVLQDIYNAAVETFRQNTVDIYMDCPSRERAGWLCDSFFTSRVERALTGESLVERNFIENFLLPERFKCLPEGMLPMCYPSDHYDGVFIPNWALWFIIELGEYFERTGDGAIINAARDRVYGLLRYLKRFENNVGLLERLESWVFIEWSKANELTQDVNFPTNFLYAAAKKVAGTLYEDQQLLLEARELLETSRDMSFDGNFFCDNAVRVNGQLVLSGEYTESCQYYAFYFNAATPETHGALLTRLVEDFGPDRRQTGKWPGIHHANAFIGNYLRLDLLKRYGYNDKVRENIEGYFAFMAERTGTLWENDSPIASCNHGFASHVICWLEDIK